MPQGIVTEAILEAEMRQNNVRHDVFDVLDRTQALAA
jgi:hypothetical protein